ncbi:MAG: O-antigen ligase family protein [Patescibacteria group bacterium]
MKDILLSGLKSKSREKLLFFALVFLFPTQLGYHFWPDFAHVFGIRVDYLSPTIYLTDLLVVALFILWSRGKKLFFQRLIKRNLKYLAPLFIFVILNVSLAPSPWPALYKWIKVLEFLFLGYYVYSRERREILKTVKVMTYSLLLFSLLGIFQFLLQRTLGGPFYFLGERSFSFSTPGIALVNIFTRQYLRAYSTFSHPNSFAGYLGVILLLTSVLTKKKSKVYLAAFLLGASAFLLAFSWGAFLSLIIVVLFYLFLKKRRELSGKIIVSIFFVGILASLLLPKTPRNYPNLPRDISYRLSLSKSSLETFLRFPLVGIGLNNFVVALPETNVPAQLSWRLQPVHNIFLLVLSETGIVGLLVFVYLLYVSFKNLLDYNWQLSLPLLFILLTGLADHYWLTLQQNQLLMSFVLGLSFIKRRLLD